MSSIEWTDKTWNPIAGCRRVGPGCDNCYAITMANRLAGFGQKKYIGVTHRSGGRVDWTGKFSFDPAALDIPRRVNAPTIWFANSMSDLFGEGVQDDWLI
jgi:protein gp37